MSELDDVARQVDALATYVLAGEAQAAKAAALAEFPDAAPFADLIEGTDPVAVRELAKELSDRAQLVKGASQTAEGGGPDKPQTMSEWIRANVELPR